MKIIIHPFLAANFIILLLNINQLDAAELEYECNVPSWNAPAESKNGIFVGDLSIDCSIIPELESFSLPGLRKRIAEKVELESLVHQGPPLSLLLSDGPLTWDVSHRFEEEGDTIQIRELLRISIENGNQLKYQTYSKEITASGMAGYLRSIEFTMIITKKGKYARVSLKNRVEVKRPWYALDLIFAPIAKNICLKKINQVKEKFLPWIIDVIHGS